MDFSNIVSLAPPASANLSSPGPIGNAIPSTGDFTRLKTSQLSSINASVYSYNRSESSLSGVFADRLFGAGTRYPVTTENAFNFAGAFNGSLNSQALVLAGTTGSIEIDVSSENYLFRLGLHVLVWHFSSTFKPESFHLEVKRGGVWETISQKTSDIKTVEFIRDSVGSNQTLEAYKLTWKAQPDSNAFLMAWHNHPYRPESTELPQWVNSASPQEKRIFGPGITLDNQAGPTHVTLRSSDGSRWRYSPDPSGNLQAIQV